MSSRREILKKAVCFDFDGVIIDSSEIQREALKKSYLKVIGNELREEKINEFFLHSGNSLENIFKSIDLPLEMIPYYKEYSVEKSREIKLFDGIIELLDNLKKLNIKCGLCTGKDRQRTLAILKEQGLIEYFESVTCSDDVNNPKPHPESLNATIKKLGVEKNNIVMVGDAVNDIICAHNAKVKSIAVTWGENERDRLLECKPNYIVDEMFGLEEAIKSSLSNDLPRKKYLFSDFVVAEDICNLQCDYCLTQTDHIFNRANKKKRKLIECSYISNSVFKEKLDLIQERIADELDVAVLKISGGEILMLPGIHQFILEQSKKYKGIQILTNGLLLNKNILDDYKVAGNICLQISLDSNNLKGNSYRTKNQQTLNKILSNIDLAYEIGIPMEINCVLTKRNVEYLPDFLRYLMKYKGGLVVYPFPVRGALKEKYSMTVEQTYVIDNIIEHYDEYGDILAPIAYMRHLSNYLRKGERSLPCYLSETSIGVFEDGTLTPCPNYWFKILGNVLEDKEKVLDRVGKDKIYKALSHHKTMIKECRACYTPWDCFNLYVEDIISYQDLTKGFLYRFNGMDEYIESVKNRIMDLKKVKDGIRSNN